MQPHEREVTLKLNSRPLRLVYLVRNREDLINAVKLYTHVWGGAANAILPLPDDELEIKAFYSALNSINPDYILTSAESIPSQVSEVLEQLPALQIRVWSEKLEKHTSDSDLILLSTGTLSTGLYNGRLSHIRRVLRQLYPTPVTNIPIHLVEPGSPYEFELALQGGFPSQSYEDFLKKHFRASVLLSPQNPEQLVKCSLLLSGYFNAASLSINEVRRVNHEGSIWIVDNKILHLFLNENEKIDVACAFWNYRRFSQLYNKLFLLREEFSKDIKSYIALITEAMPSIELVFVTTLLKNQNDAIALGAEIKEAFATVNRDIPVTIFYGNFRFNFIQGAASLGKPTTTTQVITSDRSIRFSPPVPPGHENIDFIFGYDAEITLASGRQLFMPATPSGAILLSNRSERIEYAETHQDHQEKEYLRTQTPVRASAKGVTGTALEEREIRVYIPTDEAVIKQQIKDAGLIVQSSEHTRYTQGCIKRIGGFQNAINLLDQKGADIISALVNQESNGEESEKYKELGWNEIRRFLQQKRHWTTNEVSGVLKQKLKLFLSTGFMRRGYFIECSTCNFSNWYSIDEVREIVECRGCAEKIQLPLDKQFSYKLNELPYQIVKTGELAVFMTASILYKIERSSFIEFGGKLFHPSENKNFVEIDLFCLIGNSFILAECKSINKIRNQNRLQEKVDEIKKQLERNVEAATLLNAQVVVLGVASEIPELPQLLQAAVAEVAEKAEEKQVGVHLVLNWKLYLWGSEEITELWRVRSEHLRVNQQPTEEKLSVTVGKLPEQGIRGGSGEMMNYAILKLWKEQLSLSATINQQDTGQDEDWQYLVARPHPWRRQLYIKGRKLLASTVRQDMIANEMSPEQAAENWELPLTAIYEVIRYCESHRELLKLEADEERHRLEEKGVSLEPTAAP